MRVMKETKKTIPLLKKEMKDGFAALTDSYKALGNKLMLDAANPISEKSAPAQAELIQWQKLRDERSFCTGIILEIKNNTARISELGKFKTQIENNKSASAKKMKEVKASFLFKLYTDYSAECQNLFSGVIDTIHPLESELDGARNEIISLEKQKAEANFFSRIGLSGKITAQKSKIKKTEKNIAAILANSVDGVQFLQEIKTLTQAPSFPAELKSQYDKLCALYNSFEDSKNRITMIEEEIGFIHSKLAESDAQKNPSKRISAITNRIKEIDAALDSILEKTGLNYANDFYTEEGEPTADGNGENYEAYLKRISLNRKKVTEIKYNIEYCETMQQIRTEELRIKNLHRVIKNSEAAIEEANRKIAESESAVITAQNKIAELTDYSHNLLLKFSKADETAGAARNGENE